MLDGHYELDGQDESDGEYDSDGDYGKRVVEELCGKNAFTNCLK